jgi:hypothetical protein
MIEFLSTPDLIEEKRDSLGCLISPSVCSVARATVAQSVASAISSAVTGARADSVGV